MSNENNKSNLSVVTSSSRSLMGPFVLVLFVSAILITALLTAIIGHKFGYYRGYKASQTDITGKNGSQSLTAEDYKALQQKVDNLNTQLDTAKKERDITLNNLAKLRRNMQSIEINNLQLMQVNDVYSANLIKRGGLPLQVVAVKMEPLPENAFEYRFDVAMLASDGQQHTLRPSLTLFNESSLVEVPLEPSLYDIKGVARIRGRFIMPKGFTPKQMKLRLSSNGQNIEKLYNWQLADPVDNMPLSLSEVPEVDQSPVRE